MAEPTPESPIAPTLVEKENNRLRENIQTLDDEKTTLINEYQDIINNINAKMAEYEKEEYENKPLLNEIEILELNMLQKYNEISINHLNKMIIQSEIYSNLINDNITTRKGGNKKRRTNKKRPTNKSKCHNTLK